MKDRYIPNLTNLKLIFCGMLLTLSACANAPTFFEQNIRYSNRMSTPETACEALSKFRPDVKDAYKGLEAGMQNPICNALGLYESRMQSATVITKKDQNDKAIEVKGVDGNVCQDLSGQKGITFKQRDEMVKKGNWPNVTLNNSAGENGAIGVKDLSPSQRTAIIDACKSVSAIIENNLAIAIKVANSKKK